MLYFSFLKFVGGGKKTLPTSSLTHWLAGAHTYTHTHTHTLSLSHKHHHLLNSLFNAIFSLIHSFPPLFSNCKSPQMVIKIKKEPKTYLKQLSHFIQPLAILTKTCMVGGGGGGGHSSKNYGLCCV